MNILPCTCTEGKYQNEIGEVVDSGLHVHDCEYIARRNSLLSTAAAFADREVPDDPGGRFWCRVFSSRMTELMRQGNGTAT